MQAYQSGSKVLNTLYFRKVRRVLSQKGMLTVEAAILVPLLLLSSVIILMVMLSQFQFALMTASQHQQGITTVNRVSTEVLRIESLPETAGRIMVEEAFRTEGEVTFGVKSLYLTATLIPNPKLTKFLKVRKTHSMHLSIPLPMSLYMIFGNAVESKNLRVDSGGSGEINDKAQEAVLP